MRLYTGFLGAYRVNGLSPGPMLIPITRPSPSEPIALIRSVCRMHILKTTPSLYAATLLFVRTSDFAIIGGAACDTGLFLTRLSEAVVDRDIDWGADSRHFRIEIGEGLLGIFQTYVEPTNPSPRPDEFTAEVDILFAYAKFNPSFNPMNPTVSEFL